MATILLVEDEPALARIISETLQKHGYRVLHASNGQAALSQLQQRQPDLIILDWALLALGEVKELYALRQVSPAPVLMLTARNAESNGLIDGLFGIEFNADETLAKPFSRGDLVARVQALLHRAERVQQIVGADRERRTQSLAYQNLSVDAAQRRATMDGQPLDLTPIEFDLLALLMSCPGRVFSKAYLLETVWKDTCAGEERSLEAVMQTLRQKLGAGGLIEPVLGAGYRLKPAR